MLEKYRVTIALCATVMLISAGPSEASQWYEDAGNSSAHVSQTACDVMTSAITHWFTKDGQYQIVGNVATAKRYAIIPSSTVSSVLGGKSSGYRQIEVHNLSNKDGTTLASLYRSVGNAGVPFFVQIVPVAAQVGAALALIDWAVKNNALQSNASDLAALMTSGGQLRTASQSRKMVMRPGWSARSTITFR